MYNHVQIYKYKVILVENLLAIQVSARIQNCCTLSFIEKFIDNSSWVINLLLDALVCTVTV